MELLEYQAKQLFQQVGIPTLPSQIIFDARELKNINIPYPVVLKSQVCGGGRGKAGGVKRVQNTIDAIAAARTIFNLAIAGQYPEVLLAETHYESRQEIFLAVVLDYELKRPVLLGSAHGGMDINLLLANLHQVVIEETFSPFYARRLLSTMGITGDLVPVVSGIIEKMYNLLLAKDLELIEINPLAISESGEVMALDGKVTVHGTAIAKHPDLAEFGDSFSDINAEVDTSESPPLFWEHDVQGGNIALVTMGVGSAALMWDKLHQLKGHPYGCWILEPSGQGAVFSPEALEQQMASVWEQLKQLPQVNVLLVNLVADEQINQQILQGLVAQANQQQQVINRAPSNVSVPTPIVPQSSFPEIVVRCLPMIENTFDSSLYWETALDDALKRAIALGKQQRIRM